MNNNIIFVNTLLVVIDLFLCQESQVLGTFIKTIQIQKYFPPFKRRYSFRDALF